LPRHAELLVSRPPYDLDGEKALLRRHGITHLVSKNSGGDQTAAKLEAARQMGVDVIMITRPTYGPALEVASVEQAVEALDLGDVSARA
jgi:precorrin-6A/cobalt-precorrin-6A reductase